MAISYEDRQYILEQVEEELDNLEEYEIRNLRRSKHSFGEWVRDTVREIAEAIGYVISLPFRIIRDFIEGLWEGLFG